MPIIKYQRFLNLILFFCIFALISAYFIQYILGHQPCNLCLVERVPYISAVIIILLCFYLKKFEKICLILLSLIFFFICLISRGLRFFIVSYLSFKFGDTFNKFMETEATKLFTILGILIVGIFGLIYFMVK